MRVVAAIALALCACGGSAAPRPAARRAIVPVTPAAPIVTEVAPDPKPDCSEGVARAPLDQVRTLVELEGCNGHAWHELVTTPLMRAVAVGDAALVAYLIDAGTPVDFAAPSGTASVIGKTALWIAVQAGVIAVGIAMIGGVTIGLIAGYFGGRLDYALSRTVEGMQAFPVVLLAIVITAILGPSIRHAMIAIGIATIPDFVRITRGVVLPTKEEQFVEASRVMGASHGRTLWRAILPSCIPPLIVLLSFSIANAILYESGLSFLGFGIQPPTPSWGNMLTDGQDTLSLYPWLAIFPGLMIFLTVIAINYIGDALRDALDPYRVSGRAAH